MQNGVCGSGIAIVDDERVIVEFYRKIFDMKQIPVVFVAYDGNEAVKKFQESPVKPQVIIMDFRMPTMDGIEAAKSIMNMEPKTKIIFVTADPGSKTEAMKLGAAGFIEKPVGLKEIMAQVELVLNEQFPAI
jgi:two-component system chemotaxis response regulator CheY